MKLKNEAEIELLKIAWKRDPCWDIEKTEGFERHKDELLAFKKQCEQEWAKQHDEQLDAFVKAEGLQDESLAVKTYLFKKHNEFLALCQAFGELQSKL